MRKFFKNVIIPAIIVLCGIALYQIKLVVDAGSLDLIVTSVSSGVLYYSGDQFDVSHVALTGIAGGDQIRAVLSDSPSSGQDFNTKPRTARQSIFPGQYGWTGTITVTGFFRDLNYTGDTIRLHILVKDGGGFPKGYGMQEITFVGSGSGGGGTPALIVSEIVAEGSGDIDWIEFLSLSGDRHLSGGTLDVYDNAGVLTTYNLTGGTIPASGLLVLQYDFPNTGGMIVLKNNLGETGAKVIYNDSGIYNNDTQNYAGIIPLGKSATQGMGGVRSINNNPNPGWFNDAVAPGSCSDLLTALSTPPTLSFIASCLSGESFGGVLTNMGNMQDPTHTPSSGSGALYFEKPGRGKITFNKEMNLTDEATTKLLQAMGQQLDMQSGGRIGFDASITGYISNTLRTANAELVMYNVNQLGVYEALSSGMIFSKDSDTHALLSGGDVPDLSGFAYTGLNSGTLIFHTNHFTSFEIAKVKNTTQMKGYDTLVAAVADANTGDTIIAGPGTPAESSLTIDKPLNISGSTVGMVTAGGVTRDFQYLTLEAKPIIMTGFSAQEIYVHADASIGNAVMLSGYLGINLTSGATYTESGIVINTHNVNFQGLTYGSLTNPAIIDCGGAGTAITINESNVHVRGIEFINCTKDVVINSGFSTDIVDYSRIGSMIENLGSNSISATPNRWGAATKPITGTDYSGNVSFTPRCGQSTCTTQVNDDAILSNLTLNTGILSGAFSSGTYTYTVNFPYSFTGTLTATPTTHDTGATVTGNTLTLSTVGSTGTIVVTVTASDTITTGVYTITVTRSAPSTDTTLNTLTPSTGTLSPTFSSGTYAYTINFPYSFTGAVTITGTKNDTFATITSGNYSLNLTSAGMTGSMFITVTSESGDIQTYTVTVTRSAPSNDANLSSLSVSPGTLSGTFNSGTNTYTVNYAYSQTGTVTITGTKNDTFATITSGNYSLPLTIGSTGSMFITVTAEDSSTKTYTVTVTRSPASTDANLSSLTVSGGTLSGTFSSGTYAYTINFPYSFTGTVTITGTKNDTYATITSGNYSLNLTSAGMTGSMFITVTSESGDVQTYTVTIMRDAPSTDANLNDLTVSTGTLSPTFSSGITGYTINFPYQYTGAVTITGTKNHTYATITSGSYSLTLTKGSTGSMFITVTSESGDIQTYTVTVTRTPASTDANLSSLTVSTGSLSGTFSSGTTSYILQMLYSYIGTITSTPVVGNVYATITGTTSITLATAGSTGLLSSTVTAEDGTTTKEYTINVIRSTPTSVGIDAIDGTVIVTGGSATISGATSTGATFESTGTLHIIGDTTNDYLEISVSGLIITASGGTWDNILLAPTNLLAGDSNNATIGEIGLTNTSTTTYTVLITIQAGANNDFLTATGGYFNISFVVPGGTNGDIIKLYRSENGSTWTTNTPDTTCTLNSSLVCSFRTDHVSYFAAVKETTSSGGSNGGGGAPTIAKDVCPHGDNSPSFYDNTCEPSGSTTGAVHGAAIQYTGSISDSIYPTERNNAYLHARGIGITTMNTIQNADMEGMLIRSHMAKIMATYAIKILHQTPNTGTLCIFNDISHQSTEMKIYITLACQLGLMGVGINDFDPNGEVTRAQFGTVLSRSLYGSGNNTSGELYYFKHLNTLKTNNIIINTNPYLKEIRGYVMLMLMRADQ